MNFYQRRVRRKICENMGVIVNLFYIFKICVVGQTAANNTGIIYWFQFKAPLTQLSVKDDLAAKDDQVPGPCTCVGDLGEVLDPWLQPG